MKAAVRVTPRESWRLLSGNYCSRSKAEPEWYARRETGGARIRWFGHLGCQADLKKTKEAFVALEIECFGPFPVRRGQPDGQLEWEVLVPQSVTSEFVFIDWMECINPSNCTARRANP